MKAKIIYRILSGIFCLIGLTMIFESTSFTGAAIGTTTHPSSLGVFFIFLSCFLFLLGSKNTKEETLEQKIQSHWRKYSVNPESLIADIEQEYMLSESLKKDKTPMQKKIEQATVSSNVLNEEVNKRTNYEQQFYEGHAAKGGRVIDAESHVAQSGKYRGKLLHFNQPANAVYLWIVDEDGTFILANRQTMQHEMPQMNQLKIDYLHRLHKLPHATLAKGKRVYGSGEVLVEGGKIKSFNTASGHYVDVKDPDTFNKQGEEVFRYFIKQIGWSEVPEGIRYKQKK